jgi:DNA (cytosine-5)-methyltransferase 1
VIVSYDCYNQADCGDIARTLSTEHHGTNLNVIASSINCQGGSNINVNGDSRFTEELSPTLRSNAGDNQTAACLVIDQQGCKSNSRWDEDVSPTLLKMHGFDVHAACIAIDGDKMGKAERKGGSGMGVSEKDVHAVCTNGINSTVRRLLPIECERLMGFPDNWTRIPWKGKPAEECPDSPRYKACGNSMCVNVMQWIGEQIDKVEKRK